MEFSRLEYWSGLPFFSPGDLPNSGFEPGPPSLQVDSIPSESQGSVAQFQTFPKFITSFPGSRNLTHQWATDPARMTAELKDPEASICRMATTPQRPGSLRLAGLLHTTLATTVPPSGQSPGCLPICHPGSGRATRPRLEGLTCRVGQQWPRGQHASLPERPGQPSAVPSARPPGSDKAPDEIIALGPQGGQRLCGSTSFPARKPGTAGAVAGAGGPRDFIPSQAGALWSRGAWDTPLSPRLSGVKPEGTLHSCFPLSLLVWGLGSSFSGVRVKGPGEGGPGPQPGMAMPHNAPSHWHGGCLVSVAEDRVLDLPFQEQ